MKILPLSNLPSSNMRTPSNIKSDERGVEYIGTSHPPSFMRKPNLCALLTSNRELARTSAQMFSAQVDQRECAEWATFANTEPIKAALQIHEEIVALLRSNLLEPPVSIGLLFTSTLQDRVLRHAKTERKILLQYYSRRTV